MRHFLITTGECERIVDGNDQDDAMRTFLEQWKAEDGATPLGLIMSIIETVDDDISYVSTERFCDKFGITYRKLQETP